ncbi:hypothetical protein LEM8419_00079 [Neolewinella maritima]|uniref:Secretion system C-terminal sorting domain-containing protein n=1 Tax=Neolewinella maritima TaxID=1383882 RepID=A0ABN8F442_9BACT|nr:T9SS type A sorting domain-containing protein [Neolewinella maritima]CAH0998733.1 hypothetical protein LEM8419_00079 [Neolewinella maritima]
MRLILFFLLATCGLAAQTIVPLQERAELRRASAGPAQAVDFRMACGDVAELPGVERLISGQNRMLRVDLDTTGLSSDLTDYRCIGCSTARFGTAELRGDTVLYTATAGVVQGFDTLGLTVCSPQGVCADTVDLVVLVQRPGRTVQLGNRLVVPETTTSIVVPADSLPGGTVCRSLADCEDTDYAGRGQRSNFARALGQGSNDFDYVAGRYGGTDAVCVTVCNEFGLCDTYRASFTVDRASVDLPFFDDFSYGGVRPAVELWQDEDVLINRSYGVTPPSIGVATFDGLDFDGRPYAAGGNGRRGQPRDFLTSASINLAGQSGTVLSFYLQPKGLGNRPELQDSFLVQFLDVAGSWNTVFAREGILNTQTNTVIDPFTGVLLDVPADYQYDGFQFRFVNLSTETGGVDNWNLDYVKLSNTSTSLVTQDLALTDEPFRLVAPYTSVPVRHLQAAGGELFADSIFLSVWNHRSDVTPVTQSTYTIENRGTPFFSSAAGLFPSRFFGQDNGIAPLSFETRRATFAELPTAAAIRDFLLGLDPAEDYLLATTYALTVATEDATFSPAVARNDTATTLTELADYMAYDDGSAEVAIEGQQGNVIVQRYRAYVADELTGIRIRLPRGLGSAGNQNINFEVYGEGETNRPGELLYSFSAPVLYAEDFYADSLQAFSSYALPEPLALPVGDFYIGWRQGSADRSLPVGFDRNTQPDSVQFFNAGSGFQTLGGSTRGAIMIRPLLSGADIRPTATRDLVIERLVDVYPNPTDGMLYLQPREALAAADLGVRLYTGSGQLVYAQRGSLTVDLTALPPGMYLLECRWGDRLSRHKIVRH